MDGKHGNSRSKPPGVLSTPSIPIGVIEATDVEKRCVLKKESELACPTRRAAFWQRSFDAPDLGICGLCFQTRALVKGCWPNLFDLFTLHPLFFFPPSDPLPKAPMFQDVLHHEVSKGMAAQLRSATQHLTGRWILALGWTRNGVKLCKTGSFPCLWGANTRMSNPLYLKKLCV